HVDLARVLGGYLLEHRGGHAARAAPFGPVIHNDRLVALQDLHLEGLVRHDLGRAHYDHTPLTCDEYSCTGRAVSCVLYKFASCKDQLSQCSLLASQRSASRAAAQPVPAAVTACRYVRSTTSPAAKTPSRAVRVDGWSTSRYPSGSVASCPANRSERGSCPMATNTPVTGSTCSVPSFVFLTRRPVTFSSPRTSTTSLSHRNVILGLANARSCMILEARSVSRRWTTVTDLPNLVRNRAS